MTNDQLEGIRKVIRFTFYANVSDEYMNSTAGRNELREHVEARSAIALNHVVPWLSRVISLQGKAVVEFGSGTGAIATVLAAQGADVHGYEIEAPSVEAARRRAAILGLENCQFSQISPDILPSAVQEAWEGKADIALFFAVLEHTSHEESLGLIRSAWACLRPGGLLVVTDTPNRLSYCDYHTGHMPFFNNTSDDMVALEVWRSPRADFKSEFEGKQMTDAQRINLVRWGRGISYHAFETAIGIDVHKCVVLSGYEQEIVEAWPVVLEDAMMLTYFKAKPIAAHDAFARSALNFALRKPE